MLLASIACMSLFETCNKSVLVAGNKTAAAVPSPVNSGCELLQERHCWSGRTIAAYGWHYSAQARALVSAVSALAQAHS